MALRQSSFLLANSFLKSNFDKTAFGEKLMRDYGIAPKLALLDIRGTILNATLRERKNAHIGRRRRFRSKNVENPHRIAPQQNPKRRQRRPTRRQRRRKF